MKALFSKEVLTHPAVPAGCVLALVLAAGSVVYYQRATALPAVVHAPLAAASTSTITAEGTVLPAENPDLYFEAAGRVASVAVSVGQTVAQGQLLASLDTAALSAARDQAQAGLQIAQAKLDALKAGPRAVDLSAKQTAVAQAEQALSNLYAQVPTDMSAAYSNSLGAVHADTDTLYNSPDSNPTLAFTVSDNQTATDAGTERLNINTLLNTWQGELGAGDTTPAGLDQALSDSIASLGQLRSYANLLAEAVSEAGTNTTFTTTSVTTANADLSALRTSIGASLGTLQADQQEIASAKLAVQSAQDALAQAQAPATPQDLEAAQAAVSAAQANLAAAQAALGNAVIVAPFAGTVSSVQIKVGDLASPGTSAISLTPQSALDVEGYLSEADVGTVHAGDAASITLDAYSGRTFPATVASIDSAPTMRQGVPAYKVVLQFVQNDPSLASGMTANISITPRQI